MATTKKTSSPASTKKPASTKSKTTPQKNKTTSAKTEAAQDACMLSDYDIISDVLGGHKNLVKLYGTALCEFDCEQLRKIVNSQMSECAVDQLDAFKYMNDRGMYKTEPAPEKKIKTARSKYCKCISNFQSKSKLTGK